MAVDKIRNEIGYQRENQTNIERAGNWLTDSGYSSNPLFYNSTHGLPVKVEAAGDVFHPLATRGQINRGHVSRFPD